MKKLLGSVLLLSALAFVPACSDEDPLCTACKDACEGDSTCVAACEAQDYCQ